MKRGHRSILFIAVLLIILLVPAGISLAEEHKNDIVQFGGDIVIGEEDVVSGAVVSFNGDITVLGHVQGDVVSFLGNVTLSDGSVVTGDVVVFKGDVLKKDTAVIGGKIVAAENLGELEVLEKYSRTHDNFVPTNPSVVNHNYRSGGTNTFFSSIMQLLGLLGLIALGASIFPRHLNTMSLELSKDLFRTFLIGLAAWIIYPFTMLVLTLTIIGIPVAILMGILVPVIILLGALVSAVALGSARLRPILRNTFNWAKEPNLLVEGLLGIFVLWLVSKAPIVGWLVIPVIAIFGLGVILTTKFGTNRPWFAKKEKLVQVSTPASLTGNETDNRNKEDVSEDISQEIKDVEEESDEENNDEK
ncbi:MAG: hypothetical protein APF76_03530 [Desulfitibacter sp. BRH_c19]|nr:MAG: hypothetical protein APF76_03530 [Desulfitibacter sp. BRH_c19]